MYNASTYTFRKQAYGCDPESSCAGYSTGRIVSQPTIGEGANGNPALKRKFSRRYPLDYTLGQRRLWKENLYANTSRIEPK